MKSASWLRWSFALSVALFVSLLAGYLFSVRSAAPRAVKAATVKPDRERKKAPDFALKDGDGRLVHLSDYRGKVVLLDFWATWCEPCKIEIPWFIDMQRKNKDRGFEVLGVAMDDEGWEVVKPFVADLKMNYRVVVGDDATSQLYGGVDALPTTFLIDREGKIAAVHVGLASRRDFEDGIEELLGSPAADNSSRDAVPAVIGPN